MSSGTLRPYILIAKYSLGLLDVIQASKKQRFSREIEGYTYALMKRALLDGKYYSTQEVFEILSKKYIGVKLGTEKNLQFYLGLMRSGLGRQLAGERASLT